MKKILIMLLVLGACFFVIACGNNGKEVILNHEEIMKGNLSSISGEYVNSEGEIIELESDITDKLRNDVIYMDGYYYMNVLTDDGMFGVGLTIYPIGVEVLMWTKEEGYVVSKTDISKIRIRYGHDVPMKNEEIFTRIDD